MIDALDLLHAVNSKGQDTTCEIAAALRVPDAEAEQVLRAAERGGLIKEEMDESHNVAPDFDRQRWQMTESGHAEMRRLEEATGQCQ